MPLKKPEQFELEVLEQILKEIEDLDNPPKSYINPQIWCLIATTLFLVMSFFLNRIDLVGPYWQGTLCVMAGICAAYARVIGHSLASMRIIRPYVDIDRLQLRRGALKSSLNEKT